MNESPNSYEPTPEVSVTFFDPSFQTWETVEKEILELEELCFPGKSFETEYLKKNFENAENIVLLLKKGEKIVGFTYTIPDESVPDAAYIDTTEIQPDEQGKGYVAKLMDILEHEARKRGYKFLTRHAATGNGYADKIAKNYAERIVGTYEQESEYGHQRYFKIQI